MKKLTYAFVLLVLSLLTSFASETIRLVALPDQRVISAEGTRDLVVKIDLISATTPKIKHRPQLNLAVVLDRSGSMSGAKIEKARQAAIGLVDQLQPGDVFSLVAYDSRVQVLIPAQKVEDKDTLRRRIQAIQPGGGTALYGGTERGAQELKTFFDHKRINRVILLSDGLANEGPSSPEEIRGLGRRLAHQGIAVTTIGVGDDYNEDIMAGLAEASDANYYFVQDTEKLPQIFARELGQLLAMTAREIEIEITAPSGVELLGLLGRSETVTQGKLVMRLDNLTAEQSRSLYLRCRVQPQPKLKSQNLANIQIRYRDELNAGAARQQELIASVRISNDPAELSKAEDKEIAAHRDLMDNAVAKEKALQLADSGDTRQAGITLKNQALKLQSSLSSAPAEVKSEMEQEIQSLNVRAEEIEVQGLSKSGRKSIQSEVYEKKNAKR